MSNNIDYVYSPEHDFYIPVSPRRSRRRSASMAGCDCAI